MSRRKERSLEANGKGRRKGKISLGRDEKLKNSCYIN